MANAKKDLKKASLDDLQGVSGGYVMYHGGTSIVDVDGKATMIEEPYYSVHDDKTHEVIDTFWADDLGAWSAYALDYNANNPAAQDKFNKDKEVLKNMASDPSNYI